MDISSMLVGKSDQLDNVDLMSGPRDFTIASVSPGPADQPLNIGLVENDRPWRPGITMRRLLAAMWGTDASAYVGRRVRLFRDASVTFGKDKTGGTRISHASHIDKRMTLTLPVSKGKFGAFTVEPLPDTPTPATAPTVTDEQIAATTNTDDLRGMWSAATVEQQGLIKARVAQLNAEASS